MTYSYKIANDQTLALIDALFQAELDYRNARHAAALNDSALVAVTLSLLEQGLSPALPKRESGGTNASTPVHVSATRQPPKSDGLEAAADT